MTSGPRTLQFVDSSNVELVVFAPIVNSTQLPTLVRDAYLAIIYSLMVIGSFECEKILRGNL